MVNSPGKCPSCCGSFKLIPMQKCLQIIRSFSLHGRHGLGNFCQHYKIWLRLRGRSLQHGVTRRPGLYWGAFAQEERVSKTCCCLKRQGKTCFHFSRDRLSADQCLRHVWLDPDNHQETVVLSTDKLKKFIIRRKWQVCSVNGLLLEHALLWFYSCFSWLLT